MLKNRIAICLSITILFFNTAFASVPTNEECHVIRDSYSSDANIILGILNSMHTDATSSQIKQDLANGILNISEQPYYTVLKAVYDTIKADISSPNTNQAQQNKLIPFLIQFHDQKESMDSRVKEWKSTQYHSTSCRDKHGCMLGQPGTYCAVNIGG